MIAWTIWSWISMLSVMPRRVKRRLAVLCLTVLMQFAVPLQEPSQVHQDIAEVSNRYFNVLTSPPQRKQLLSTLKSILKADTQRLINQPYAVQATSPWTQEEVTESEYSAIRVLKELQSHSFTTMTQNMQKSLKQTKKLRKQTEKVGEDFFAVLINHGKLNMSHAISSSPRGWSGLHFAANEGFAKLAARLISAGSPLHTIEQLFNSSALDLAIKRHDMTMVELLLRHRAHVAACGTHRRPVDVAHMVGAVSLERLIDEALRNEPHCSIEQSTSTPESEAAVDGVVRRLDVHEVNGAKLFAEHVALSRPLLITNGCSDWPAVKQWQPDVLAQSKLAKKRKVTTGRIPYADGYNLDQTADQNVELGTFIREHMGSGRAVQHDVPLMVWDDEIVMQSNMKNHINNTLVQSMKGVEINERTQFYMGPPGSGAPMHFHCHAMNALIHGAKRWFLLPPASAFFSNTPMKLWVENELAKLPLTQQPIEVLQNAGDLLYVPPHWAHGTLNVEDSVGVATEFSFDDC